MPPFRLDQKGSGNFNGGILGALITLSFVYKDLNKGFSEVPNYSIYQYFAEGHGFDRLVLLALSAAVSTLGYIQSKGK